MNNNLQKDALLSVTRALPNGAANVTSTALDTGIGARGCQPSNPELLLTTPALNTTQLPDAKTMKYDIIGSPNSDLSAPTVTVSTVVTQTGAGGAGAAAGAPYRYRVPKDGPQYWGVKATGSASGDATAASCTLEMVF